MNSEDEKSLGVWYYNRLTTIHGVNTKDALDRCMSMFYCPDEFWEQLANVQSQNKGA